MSQEEMLGARTALGDYYDKMRRSLDGLPDTTWAGPATVQHKTPVLDKVQTFTVETCRQTDRGEYVFLTYTGAEGSIRLVLPPEVTERISRQSVAAIAKRRRAAAKAESERRKAQGWKPNFKPRKKAKK